MHQARWIPLWVAKLFAQGFHSVPLRFLAICLFLVCRCANDIVSHFNFYALFIIWIVGKFEKNTHKSTLNAVYGFLKLSLSITQLFAIAIVKHKIIAVIAIMNANDTSVDPIFIQTKANKLLLVALLLATMHKYRRTEYCMLWSVWQK